MKGLIWTSCKQLSEFDLRLINDILFVNKSTP